jgi:outer membrane protein OmpA-like peptidoglycan-associated protein
MTRHAAHGRKAAENRPASRLKGPAGAALGALVMAAALTPALTFDAAAQSRSGIFINNDVLNNLGPGPDAAQVTPLNPTPLTPGGPAPSYQYQAPGLQTYQAPAYQAPATQSGNGGLTFQTQGSGNFVVTRPGTLLFPPLEAPSSTLAPGFGGIDNQAARAEALNNAFAEGPEPSSQLLIPLDSGAGTAVANTGVPGSGGSDSVTINMGALPPADPTAQVGSAPLLTLRRPPVAPPQPAPRKPEVPAEMLAEVDLAPIDNGPAELAPEFQAPAPTEVADLPAAAMQTQEPAEAPEAALAVDETPEPELAEMPAAAPESAQASAPMSSAPVSSADVPAPVALAETPASVAPESAPVSLLPADSQSAATSEPMPAAAPAPAPSGLQTASLTIEGVEDMTFLFDVDSAELSDAVQIELRSLADTLHTNEEWIQVLGFASGDTATTDQARKLALSRALKVRSFLIDAGIASARIQVRSLGDRAEGGPANRVDIKPIGS